ncbi:MAG TPA: hypothetical protein VF509_12030 [Sphingobium sp.]
MVRSTVIALFALAMTAPVHAQTADAPAQAAAPTPAPDKSKSDRLICKDNEELGTRLKRNRTCKTSAEWAAERQGNREWLQHMQTNKSCGLHGC